ncbi:MAG: translation initiation factor IF-2 [Candidatus Acidiferrales bacterium]
MTEAGQIRINELARELEIKAKALIEFLPELGITEKKTHSSSLDNSHADLVRKHFRELAESEAAAERAKAAKEAEAKAAKSARPAAPVAKPAVTPPAVSSRPAAEARPEISAAPAAPRAVRPVAGPLKPALASPAAAAPVAPATASLAPKAPVRSAAPKPPAPGQQVIPTSPPTMARPAAGAATPKRATPPLPPIPRAPMPSAPRPSTMRPATSAAPSSRPSSVPSRPGVPAGRAPQRTGFPQRTGGAGGPRGSAPAAPAKPEPGKPIYARKPAPRPGRPLIEKRFAEGERKLHPVRTRAGVGERRGGVAQAEHAAPVVREAREITITEGVTIRELAEKLDVRAKDLLKTLLDRGVFASINQALDIQTATSLAEAFSGIVKVASFEETLAQEDLGKVEHKGQAETRAPVVTVMGHVDHGKTSLLDVIRETEVAAGESGGITQHIGASTVQVNGRRIVFIDTPGHEAFTRMRARGAKVTDLVVLVVAADDGVMPQTEEAIDHARAAGVPIIVAINKMDKPEAQAERVKRQLADRGLMPEEWGGDTVMAEVSARTKKGIDHLLEMILLVGDLRDLKANPESPASGSVLESRVDKGRGPVATVLVQNGTLHVGDTFLCGAVFGKVRAMFDDRGHPVTKAGPATPVEVLGLQGVPEAGDPLQVADEAKARHIVEYRQSKLREQSLAKSATSRLTLDQLHEQLLAGEVKELPLLIKADVQGSVEVLSEMLPKLSNDKVKLKIIHASVGAVSETDVLLASASNAIIVAFNVRPERKATDLAQQENVDIRLHTIIYEVVDEIKKAMEGLLSPVVKEQYLGRAEVRDTFRIKGVGMIAGCSVQDGIVKRDAQVRVLRDNVVIYTGRIQSLRRFKEDATEVRSGFECGIGVSNFSDVKVGDILECFNIERVAPAVASA